MKNEIEVKCNNGTKFRVRYHKNEGYVVEYRNDKIHVQGPFGKVKGAWVFLDRQHNYFDILAYLFEEMKNIEAKEGN